MIESVRPGIKYGSVCSGIEAASAAWEPLGWVPAWFSEVDAAANRVLAHRFPNVPNHGDMTKLPGRVRRRIIPAPDVLVGGTPCQAFSVAGLRGGMSDPRGQLTLAFVLLADAIDEVRIEDGLPPVIIVWENVPGVLNHSDNPFGCFLAGVAGESVPLVPAGRKWSNAGVVLGPKRSVAWRTFDAQWFGLAQRRRRVFVVGSADEWLDPGAILLEFEGVRRDSPPSRKAGETITHDVAQCLGASGRGVERTGEPRGQDPVVAFSVKDYGGDALEECSPTLRAGGFTSSHANGGVMPAIAFNARASDACIYGDVTGTLDVNQQTHAVCVTGDVAHTLKAEGFDASEDGIGRDQPVVAFQTRGSNIDLGQDVTGTIGSNCDRASGGAPCVTVSLRGREGGGTIEVGGEVATALRASSGGGDKPHVFTNYRVRRLMPVECERLQGFPDNWTAIPSNRGKDGVVADGPRYKQIGNSMAVPCMRWIGNRIDKALR